MPQLTQRRTPQREKDVDNGPLLLIAPYKPAPIKNVKKAYELPPTPIRVRAELCTNMFVMVCFVFADNSDTTVCHHQLWYKISPIQCQTRVKALQIPVVSCM